MRTFITKIINLLDGTPALYGKRQRGQSVVELALITPILIIMFAGLVEIGWFANNYLNLMDVVRYGARRGATLQDTTSPVFWNNANSLVPNGWLPAESHTDLSTVPTTGNGTENDRLAYRAWDPNTGRCPATADGTDIGVMGFYNNIICLMLKTMPPIRVQRNDLDDIIVSSFAVARVDPSRDPTPGTTPWLGPNRPMRDSNGVPLDIPQVVVVGRYPTNANECDVAYGVGNAVVISPQEPRDPFDFNENQRVDFVPLTGETLPRTPTTLWTQNVFNEVTINSIPGYDHTATSVGAAEKQVGFSWFGVRRIPGTPCVGSTWRIADIERLLNLNNYDMRDYNYNVQGTPVSVNPGAQSRRMMLPSQGLVLVEMFWQHELLLKIPVLSPVFQLLGDRTIISVWAIFPLPQIEPYIPFP